MNQPIIKSVHSRHVISFLFLMWMICYPSNNRIYGQATISINNPTVTEGDAGTSTVTFTVLCDPCASVNAIIDWRINDGTATTGDSDYIDKSGRIDDLGNSNSVETVNITVEVNGDTKVEADETFELELYNASVGAPSLLFKNNDRIGTATIINDDDEEHQPADECRWVIIVIILFIIILALLTGAHLAQAFLFVPYWKSMDTKSFYEYYKIEGDRLYLFFKPLTMIVVILAIILLILIYVCFPFLVIPAFIMSLLVLLILSTFFLYFKNANLSFRTAALSSEALESNLENWSKWHWFRIILEVLALLISFYLLIQL